VRSPRSRNSSKICSATPVTINITVGYGEVGGQAMPTGALGANISFLNSYGYAQIKNAFAADSKTSDDATAVGTLPASSPAPGGGAIGWRAPRRKLWG
jgi:hypothetical protein